LRGSGELMTIRRRAELAVSRAFDVHTHYLPTALAGALEARSDAPRICARPGGRVIEYGKGSGHPLLDSMVDLELRLRDMDETGIDLALLTVSVPGVDWFGRDDGIALAREVNDELAELVRARPERFAALATLPMQAPEAAAAELERAVATGLWGAMVYSNAAGEPLDRPELEAVFDAAAALDVPVMIHPTFPLSAHTLDAYALVPALGFLVDTTTAVLRLLFGGLYERHPDFKLFLCHAGSLLPQLAGRIDYEAGRLPRGTGKLNAPPSERMRLLYTDSVCAWPPALRSALELVGPERVMFGSDYPFWRPERTLDVLAELNLPDVDRDALMYANAERFFRRVPARA
jgi:predicted TIM-barrel fold metal-dependent hydrolase